MKKKIIVTHSIRGALGGDCGCLNRADFQIHIATSGEEAFRIHKQERVDLLVAELDMADLPGDQLCKRIRSESELRNLSIILACHNDPKELERIRICGANAFLVKPFRPVQLIEKMEQLLSISARRGYRVLLKAKVLGSLDSSTFFCFSHNVSTTGMLIETERLLAKGDIVNCSFFLPGSSQIVVDGEVVRVTNGKEEVYHYGLRFNRLSKESHLNLEGFISGVMRKA